MEVENGDISGGIDDHDDSGGGVEEKEVNDAHQDEEGASLQFNAMCHLSVIAKRMK